MSNKLEEQLNNTSIVTPTVKRLRDSSESPTTPPTKVAKSAKMPDEGNQLINIGTMSFDQFWTLFEHKLNNTLEQQLDKKLVTVLEKLNKVDELEVENRTLRAEVSYLKNHNEEMERKIETLDGRGRRSNLIFHGLRVEVNSSAENTVRNLCEHTLGLMNVDISRAYEFGKNHKAVFVEFIRCADVDNILRNSKKLKGTNVSVERDCTRAVQMKKIILLQIKKEIRRLKPDMNPRVLNDTLIVDGVKFTWCKVNGLCNGSERGADVLFSKWKINIGEFIDKQLHPEKPQQGIDREN